MASQFARKLNLFDATMIVISGIIGSGIFINPYIVAQKVGTPFLILAVWIAGGVFALVGAFVFAELSTVMPKVGGQYAFFREAFHPLVAFLHGWSLMFIIQSGATAGVAVAFAKYLQPLFGFDNWLVTPVAIAILLGLASFHALGIKPGAILINVITFGKTLAIAALIVGAFLLTKQSGITFKPMTPPDLKDFNLLSAFFAGLVPTMFSYGGWQNLNFVSEEVKDPLRNLPRAILIGVLCVIAVYVSANFAYVHVLGAEALAATETPAADVAAKLAGPFGAKAISFLIVVSTFGFMNLALLSAPRVYYAMAADGVFFKSIGKLSPRFQTPAAAILLQGVLAAVFALSNSYKELVGYAVFADWIFFALAGAALMVFRRTMPDAPRPLPVPFYPLTPILFILFGIGIVFNTFITDWKNARIGATIIAAGVPVFYFWKWLRKESSMRKTLTLILFVVLLGAGQTSFAQQSRWTEQQANDWYARQPWLVGANYGPASAINQLEMWQAESFDPAAIDKELGWAESLGMNTMRVFLHDLLWQQDAKGFQKRLNQFLSICAKHKIKPMLVLFDSVWDPNPQPGKQRAPKPGVHNSGWMQGPGAKALQDAAQYPRLEAYVKGVVGAFAKDNRILAWDVWNEPDNLNGSSYSKQEPPNKVELVNALLLKVFAWARTAKPRQPLTAGPWKGDWSSDAKLSATDKILLAESDIITFHSYEDGAKFEQRIQSLQRYNRPILCTEYMARGNKSTFEASLPIAKKYKVAAFNWGFVQGKTQTHLPWDSWQNPYVDREPAIWFHEVFRADGSPYRVEEVELIRKLTGKK